MSKYVLDTSAILSLLYDEKEADQVEKILEKGRKQKAEIYISFITLTEVYYLLKPYQSKEEFTDYTYFRHFPMEVIWADENLSDKAGFLKAEYGLPLGDAWIAATANYLGAVVIHRDRDYLKLGNQIKQEMLK